jgi:predicted metal-dependent hydrolase
LAEKEEIPGLKDGAGVLTLAAESGDIPIRLVRGKGRRARITILLDGEVRLTVPRHVSAGQAIAFAREKAAWIERTVRKVEAYSRPATPARSVETGRITVLGHDYPLKIEPGGRRAAIFRDEALVVAVPDPGDVEAVRRRIETWLKKRAVDVFGMVMERCLETAPDGIGSAAPPWTVRRMKRRWGSCGRDGRIVFNVRLVQTPMPLVEYVVMHELCHLKHHNHGKAFYALLSQCLPDWKTRRKALNAIAVE